MGLPITSLAHALSTTQALHPYLGLRKAGFEVDLVSETGKWSPDYLSLQADYLKGEDKQIYEDTSSEFRSKLDKDVKKPSDVDPKQYSIFFASAGHASLIDYPEAKGLQTIGSKIYQQGGIVSAVCHGGAIFVGMQDLDTGKPIIDGKRVTGFTNAGEEEHGLLPLIKSWNRPTIEESAAESGATYVSPAGPWDSFTVTDGRVVTGANPQSAHAVTEAMIEAYNKL